MVNLNKIVISVCTGGSCKSLGSHDIVKTLNDMIHNKKLDPFKDINSALYLQENKPLTLLGAPSNVVK